MALTLVVEDGSGKSDANSYVSVAEADSYNEGHVSTSGWDALTTGQKEAALVMAARTIDGSFQFKGFKTVQTQALQWPRDSVKDPDSDDSVYPRNLSTRFNEFANDTVPQIVKNAAIEMARELVLTGDSVSGFHQGAGLKSVSIDGFTKIEFDKMDIKKMIPRAVITYLSKIGTPLFGMRTARVTRY